MLHWNDNSQLGDFVSEMQKLITFMYELFRLFHVYDFNSLLFLE